MSRSGSTSGSKNNQCSMNYEVGSRAEVKHQGHWYLARVLRYNPARRSVFIHYERWSSRYDTWISVSSPDIRPIARPPPPCKTRDVFSVGDEVFARWSDGRMYPAVVTEHYSDTDRYQVRYSDGFVRQVKSSQISAVTDRTRHLYSSTLASSSSLATPSSSSSSATAAELATVAAPSGEKLQQQQQPVSAKRKRKLNPEFEQMMRQMQKRRRTSKEILSLSTESENLELRSRARDQQSLAVGHHQRRQSVFLDTPSDGVPIARSNSSLSDTGSASSQSRALSVLSPVESVDGDATAVGGTHGTQSTGVTSSSSPIQLSPHAAPLSSTNVKGAVQIVVEEASSDEEVMSDDSEEEMVVPRHVVSAAQPSTSTTTTTTTAVKDSACISGSIDISGSSDHFNTIDPIVSSTQSLSSANQISPKSRGPSTDSHIMSRDLSTDSHTPSRDQIGRSYSLSRSCSNRSHDRSLSFSNRAALTSSPVSAVHSSPISRDQTTGSHLMSRDKSNDSHLMSRDNTTDSISPGSNQDQSLSSDETKLKIYSGSTGCAPPTSCADTSSATSVCAPPTSCADTASATSGCAPPTSCADTSSATPVCARGGSKCSSRGRVFYTADEARTTRLPTGWAIEPVIESAASTSDFTCSQSGCNKQFRKQRLLQLHLKHYHGHSDLQVSSLEMSSGDRDGRRRRSSSSSSSSNRLAPSSGDNHTKQRQRAPSNDDSQTKHKETPSSGDTHTKHRKRAPSSDDYQTKDKTSGDTHTKHEETPSSVDFYTKYKESSTGDITTKPKQRSTSSESDSLAAALMRQLDSMEEEQQLLHLDTSQLQPMTSTAVGGGSSESSMRRRSSSHTRRSLSPTGSVVSSISVSSGVRSIGPTQSPTHTTDSGSSPQLAPPSGEFIDNSPSTAIANTPTPDPLSSTLATSPANACVRSISADAAHVTSESSRGRRGSSERTRRHHSVGAHDLNGRRCRELSREKKRRKSGYNSRRKSSISNDALPDSDSCLEGASAPGVEGDEGDTEQLDSTDVVNCHCGNLQRDAGLMIQCELCLSWQHGCCLGLTDSRQVPDAYICQICRHPHHQRPSHRLAWNQQVYSDGVAFRGAPSSVDGVHYRRTCSMMKSALALTSQTLQLRRHLRTLRSQLSWTDDSMSQDPGSWPCQSVSNSLLTSQPTDIAAATTEQLSFHSLHRFAAIPEVNRIPEVTNIPEVANAPEISTIPEVVNTVEVTDTSEVSSLLEVTDIPDVSSSAEVKNTPEVSSIPEVCAVRDMIDVCDDSLRVGFVDIPNKPEVDGVSDKQEVGDASDKPEVADVCVGADSTKYTNKPEDVNLDANYQMNTDPTPAATTGNVSATGSPVKSITAAVDDQDNDDDETQLLLRDFASLLPNNNELASLIESTESVLGPDSTDAARVAAEIVSQCGNSQLPDANLGGDDCEYDWTGSIQSGHVYLDKQLDRVDQQLTDLEKMCEGSPICPPVHNISRMLKQLQYLQRHLST